MWDASVVWSPTKTFEFAAIAVLPAYGIARVIRGMYMWHYRYILDRLDEDEPATPLLLSPVRLYQTLATFFAVNARSVDVGTVYLIRIYFVLISSLVLIVIAVRHGACPGPCHGPTFDRPPTPRLPLVDSPPPLRRCCTARTPSSSPSSTASSSSTRPIGRCASRW